jgi:ATP-dependent Lon protease
LQHISDVFYRGSGRRFEAERGVIPEPESASTDTYEAPAILADDAILFPEMELNISLHDPKSLAASTQAFREHSLVVLVPSPSIERAVGSIGMLVLLRRAAQGAGLGTQALWKGLWRVRVDRVLEEEPYFRVQFSKPNTNEDFPAENSDMMNAVFEQIDEFIKVIPGIPTEIVAFLKSVKSPGRLADLCAYSPFFSRQDRLELLNTLDPDARLRKVNLLFRDQLSSMRKLAKTTSILECTTCMDLADRAFELGPKRGAQAARDFLDHVSQEHPDELLGLIAERYGPEFMRRRALK